MKNKHAVSGKDIEDIVDEAKHAAYSYAYDAREKRNERVSRLLCSLSVAASFAMMVLPWCFKSDASLMAMIMITSLLAIILGVISTTLRRDNSMISIPFIVIIMAVIVACCFHATCH